MTHNIAISVELPPGYQALESPDVTIGFGNALPYGAFATDDGRVYNFMVRKSDKIDFTPPLPNDTDPVCVGWIERAIHQVMTFKQARRAAYRMEMSIFQHASKRTLAGSGQ
jgi:hypothetical protein